MALDKDPNLLFSEGSNSDPDIPNMDYDPYTGQPINDNNNTGYSSNSRGYSHDDDAIDDRANKHAIASLILGIIGLVLAISCCCAFFSITFSILGLIFGIISNDSQGKKNGMAIAGIICSIIGMVVFLLVVIGSILFVATDTFSSSLSNSGFSESFKYYY